MQTKKKPAVTHITGPATSDYYRKLSNSAEMVAPYWNGYKPASDNKFAAPYGLIIPGARETESGDAVLPLYHAHIKYRPINLAVVRDDLHHRYLGELLPGMHTHCDDCTVDPEWIIAGESYLSSLALAERWKEHPTVHVVACYEPKNIWPTLDSIYRQWPSIGYVAAPDTRDRSLCHGTIYPPGDLTWLDLHMWEAQNQWVA